MANFVFPYDGTSDGVSDGKEEVCGEHTGLSAIQVEIHVYDAFRLIYYALRLNSTLLTPFQHA